MQATDGVECFEIDRDSVHEETKKTSIVWRYIFPVEGSNSKLKNVYCSICDRKLSYNGSTTTNLLKHLNQKHQEKIKVDNEATIAIEKSNDNVANAIQSDIREHFSKPIYSNELFNEAVIRLIVKQDESFLLVESKEFRNLVHLLNPKAKLFKADALKNKIIDLYHSEKLKKITQMKLVASKISFTTDIWTSPTQVPFLGITAHYIDGNWGLNCVTLAFMPLKGRHTGKRITEAFYNVVNGEYNICGQKHGGITLDNASNNDNFIQNYR